MMLSALLLVLAAAPKAVPLPDLTKDWNVLHHVEVAGWSADGKRVALRLFDGRDFEELNPDFPACPGYVNVAGKRYDTGLVLSVLENGKQVKNFRVQTPHVEKGDCTPLAAAKKALTEAKAAFAELGIDLTTAGTTLEVPPTKSAHHWEAQSAVGKLIIDFKEVVEPRDEENREYTDFLEGTFAARVGTTELGTVKQAKTHENRSNAGHLSPLAGPVFVSPDGKTLLIFITVERSFYEQSRHLFFFSASK